MIEEWEQGSEETRESLAKGQGITFPNAKETIKWLTDGGRMTEIDSLRQPSPLKDVSTVATGGADSPEVVTPDEVDRVVCYGCHEVKPIEEFGFYKKRATGRNRLCKKCAKDKAAQIYEQHREKYKIARLKYYYTPRGFYARLKNNAKRRGTEFNLTQVEFLQWLECQTLSCHYCGLLLNENGHRSGSQSIDRKDNSVGYQIDNITLCCNQCNTIKSSLFTEQEMLEIADKYIKPKLGVE